MKFDDAETWAMVIVLTVCFASCGGCGAAFWSSYHFARARAYAACVEHHMPSECGGALW